MVNCGAASLSLPAASCAAPAGMSTVTCPSPLGVMSTVYWEAETAVKLPAVPLPTVRSFTSKPVTASLKVMVIGIGEVLVGSEAVVVMETVGAT